MNLKFLKLVQAGYESYTGPIGAYDFVDGKSTTMIPRNDRDRLATAFQFVEYTEEGEDETPAGVAERLISESAVLAENVEPLQRQTETEKEVEDARVALSQEAPRTIYTRADLERIADKQGITGLREVAKPWDVKHRAIPELIALILGAQDVWLAQREKNLAERGISEKAFLQALGVPSEAPVEPVVGDHPAEVSDLSDAAASGDLSAAISGE